MYITYFRYDGGYFRVYDGKTFTTIQKRPDNTNAFYVWGKYEQTDDDLKKYYDDLKDEVEQFKNTSIFKNKTFKQSFNYLDGFKRKNGIVDYASHHYNVIRFFKLFRNKKLYDTLTSVSKIEDKWSRKCHNAGLYYTCITDKPITSYGYDFRNFYASQLASTAFKFPIKEGKEIKINDLSNIKYGYYDVKIILPDNNAKKLFKVCKNNIYTHYSLLYAIELQQTYDIKIILNTDVEFNAYVYNDEDLITGYKMFRRWYEAIRDIKNELPDNKIVKLLSSSFWGHMTAHSYITKTENEIKELNLKIGYNEDKCDYLICHKAYNVDGFYFYKLLNLNKPYIYPLRIKSFLTSYCRNRISKIARMDVDNVIRIHTDGICFSKPFDETITKLKMDNFLKEKKTTGQIKFPIYRPKKLKEEVESDDEDDD